MSNPWNWTPTQKDIDWTGKVLHDLEQQLANDPAKEKANTKIQGSEAVFVFHKGKKTFEVYDLKPSDFVAFCFMTIIHDHFGYEAEFILADARQPPNWRNN